MKKLLLTLALLLGVSASAQDLEIGVQYEDGLVPFVYVAEYYPLGSIGAIDLYLTPSAELTLSEPLEGWVSAELLLDTEYVSISTRLRYETTTDTLRLRAGILLGGN